MCFSTILLGQQELQFDIFCVFHVFDTSKVLTSKHFSKKRVASEDALMRYLKGKTSQKCSTFGSNFDHAQIANSARELGGGFRFAIYR